jgi:hypothetical protein
VAMCFMSYEKCWKKYWRTLLSCFYIIVCVCVHVCVCVVQCWESSVGPYICYQVFYHWAIPPAWS